MILPPLPCAIIAFATFWPPSGVFLAGLLLWPRARWPVVVAVGTDGSSPALARHLRDRIADEVLTPGIADVAAELARQRAAFHEQGISTETVDWSGRLRDALDRFG